MKTIENDGLVDALLLQSKMVYSHYAVQNTVSPVLNLFDITAISNNFVKWQTKTV